MALTTNKKNKIIAEWKAGLFNSYNAVATTYKIDPKTVKKIILNSENITSSYNYKKAISSAGYLYLVQAGDTNNYKIGIATSLKKRIIGIQSGNHLKVRIVKWCKVSHVRQKEKELHTKYKENNTINEWFYFEDISEIISKFDNFILNTTLEQVYG